MSRPTRGVGRITLHSPTVYVELPHATSVVLQLSNQPVSHHPVQRARGGSRRRVRKYAFDPCYPAGTEHMHSYLNGKCPKCPGGRICQPRFTSTRKMFHVRCDACNWYRQTDFLVNDNLGWTPPPPLRHPVTLPCSAERCSTGNKRNRSTRCVNQMCKQDCITVGRRECRFHGESQATSTPEDEPPLSSPLPTAIQPQSAPDNDVHRILGHGGTPRSTERPLAVGEESPTFQMVRRYAMYPLSDWGEAIGSQKASRADKLLFEARFCSEKCGGTAVFVAYWRKKRDAFTPSLFQRLVPEEDGYSLREDTALHEEVKLDRGAAWVLSYLDGGWVRCSTTKRYQVVPGSWLFFLDSSDLEPGEESLVRFVELLTFVTDPGFEGTSHHLFTTA